MSEWKPKPGETFYLINDIFAVVKDVYSNNFYIDTKRAAAGNCFRTYDEAAEVAEEFKSIIKEHKTTEQKPKLTVEVFDREDCPEWARWAAVDSCGEAFYYESKPRLKDDMWVGKKATKVRQIPGSYYSLDYKHSLIERPEKVVSPDWAKPDAIGWHIKIGYFNISSIDKTIGDFRVNFKTVDDNTDGYFCMHTFSKECCEARCIVDAVDLVGKKVRRPNEVIRLITRCDPNTNRVDLGDLKGIPIGVLTESQNYQLIGEIKYKYQHMEDGEWVD